MKKLNRIMRGICSVLGSLLVAVAAFGGASTASVWGLYQPKVPKCLK